MDTEFQHFVDGKRECHEIIYVDEKTGTWIDKQMWIPITERLPKDDQQVLVTLERKHDGRRFIDMGTFNDFGNGNVSWRLEYGSSDQVIAWMPMIEPYKGE